MEEIQRMLGEIDECMQNRYYPFILDDISDFYDRVRIISNDSNSLAQLLTEIHQNSDHIFEEEKDVGSQIKIGEFEKHISEINHQIATYQEREAALLGLVTSLYEEVKQIVENNESAIHNMVIPLFAKEAEMLIKKQESNIASLTAEKETYESRCKDREMRLSQLEEETKEQGVSSPLVELEQRASVHKSLLWLYSQKRIIQHSFGIQNVESEGNQIIMTFDDKGKLIMKTDENGKLCEATIDWKMDDFNEILQRGIGNDWSLFVSDLMYMMYASNHYKLEMEALRRRFVVDDSSRPTIRITFTNFIAVSFKVPEHYPCTLEKIEVGKIENMDMEKNAVYHLQSMLRNKQFFTITDFVEFVNQCITNTI